MSGVRWITCPPSAVARGRTGSPLLARPNSETSYSPSCSYFHLGAEAGKQLRCQAVPGVRCCQKLGQPATGAAWRRRQSSSLSLGSSLTHGNSGTHLPTCFDGAHSPLSSLPSPLPLAAAQACERTGAAGQIVPTQLSEKIIIFAAKLLGHHPDMVLDRGWSHMELYSLQKLPYKSI